ncbi:hypothetical protein F4782DRAFT_529713 [Xylaria castorea]|nr:hypothetical protein F4782DRAFT_529713 [Xylaria castorea]
MGIDLTLFSIGSLGWQAAVLYGKEKIADFLSNPFRQSRVPQFILDARHLWILESQGKLERLLDAGSFLCSGSNIDNNRVGVDRPGWPNAVLRLREIHRCPAVLSQVKTFNTAIQVYRGEYSDLDKRILEPQQPPREVLDLFADVLGNMTSLEILKWDIPGSDARYFEKYFFERVLVLPSVKRLEPGSASPFLVRTCPNIAVLEEKTYSDAPEALLQAAAFAPNLTRFAMSVRHGWDLSLIQGTGLQGTLQLLQSLKNLTHLDLPEASSLDVGWSGGPKCGRPFMGPRGRENRRIVWRSSAEAADRAVALVVEFLPHLTGFSIGGTQAKLIRYENGTLRASFPWTGRIGQWVMEGLPLRPDELNEGKTLIQVQVQDED